MIRKQPKPSTCVCGNKFRKYKIESYHPYCSPSCKLKHVTGNVSKADNMMDLPLQTLKEMTKGVFCQFIKLRDEDLPEITSGKPERKGDIMTAGHLWPCNQFPGMMFNEDNCFKQSDFNNANMGDHSVWLQTEKNVIERIGYDRYNTLKYLATEMSIKNYKWSKIEYIEKFKEYTLKIKELKNAINNVYHPINVVR